MAQIALSEAAPNEELRFGFAEGDFTVAAGKPFSTDDPKLIANAAAHPWLEVKDAEVTLPPVPAPASAATPDPADDAPTKEKK